MRIIIIMLVLILSWCSSIEIPIDEFKISLEEKNHIDNDIEFVKAYLDFLEYDSNLVWDINTVVKGDSKITTLTHEFLRDDSIKGNKYIFTFDDMDDYSSLSSIYRKIKCRKWRGHPWWSWANCY